MVRLETLVKVVDNSGAKFGKCIHIYGKGKRSYGQVGDMVLVSVRAVSKKFKESQRLKKGQLVKAVIVGSRCWSRRLSGHSFLSEHNAVVLLTTDNELVGSRVFCKVPLEFRSVNKRLLTVSDTFA